MGHNRKKVYQSFIFSERFNWKEKASTLKCSLLDNVLLTIHLYYHSRDIFLPVVYFSKTLSMERVKVVYKISK